MPSTSAASSCSSFWWCQDRAHAVAHQFAAQQVHQRTLAGAPVAGDRDGQRRARVLVAQEVREPARERPETNPERAKLYSLNIISPKSHAFLNSCYANEPHKIKAQGDQFVLISPDDATRRSIREGDPVRVYNDRGDFEGLAHVTDDVPTGVVVATLGYWRSLNRSDGSVNCISSDAWCGLGRAPTFSDNLVEVQRVN